MRLRQTKIICWLTGLTLLAASASVLAWAFYTPCNVNPEEGDSIRAVRSVSNSDRTPLESLPPRLKDFQPLLAKRLRRPLFDPPPPIIKPPPKKKLPPLKVKLLATMIDSKGQTAMFMTGSGDTLFRQAGQNIGNPDNPAQILEIHPQHVIVRYGDKKQTLTIDGGG